MLQLAKNYDKVKLCFNQVRQSTQKKSVDFGSRIFYLKILTQGFNVKGEDCGLIRTIYLRFSVQFFTLNKNVRTRVGKNPGLF